MTNEKTKMALLASAAVVAVLVVVVGLSVWPANSLAETADPNEAETVIRELPEPNENLEFPLIQAISQRRSVRTFKPDNLSEQQLSMLLWSAQGITCEDRSFRAAPSAGATYPLELFVFDKNGVHHYMPEQHGLATVSEEDQRDGLSQAALGQASVAQAPVSVVITADYDRTEGRYGERAERYVHIEVGHAAQNVHLKAVSMGLSSVPIGAFDDDSVSALLRLSEELDPLYIIPVGHPAE